ncbi:hypothetical protein T440DRAFT_409113 [Plenodomus tracheiphilus IPT5]|uniref:J domain-containing protein n=1 Tax=Plenodomus tracheiphilus IPT5 TaxID=1408161 RepID=A0A6A7AP95_9PLEO|nr:hypothetical protein T440DRAFT_409113 [Plenodomus tracheiphilus IPT5]
MIQSTYTRLAMLNHPDKQVGKPADQQKRAAKRMCEINQAKGILCEEERRRAYDEVGAVFQFEYEAWKKSNEQESSGYKGPAGKYYPSY